MKLFKNKEWDSNMIKKIKEGSYPIQKIVDETDEYIVTEERAWVSKAAKSLTDKQKNEIIEKMFDIVIENIESEDMYENIGEAVYDYLTSKDYVHREE